jgi:class 3 adenylate cyclase
VYETIIVPRNVLGRLGWPFVAAASKYQFGKVFARYDKVVQAKQMPINLERAGKFVPGGQARLERIRERLLALGQDSDLVGRLVHVVTTADEFVLTQLRPYTFATQWNIPRRTALQLFLLATREGMLSLQWEVLCPYCRGSQEQHNSLSDINANVHCDSCQIDFNVNFNQSVELTFAPSPSIRVAERMEFCIAGPEATPHIVTQQLLQPNERKTVIPVLENGRYRLRTILLSGSQSLAVTDSGAGESVLSTDWQSEELQISANPILHFENHTNEEQLIILERTAWNDDAATAAEVTTLQQFRDLFANEALRPGEQFSVGSLTILFTDLRDSTRMYREIGDAPAFGLVMNHFDVLRQAITDENGAIVKTIGDAVMAVFQRPVSAVRAMIAAQQVLMTPPPGERPLHIKAAIHYGPSITVNLNDRLDYFGTTVNMAARLEKFSQGGDLILSDAVYNDPEVQELLTHQAETLQAVTFTEMLKGFDDESFSLWRITSKT